MSSRPVPTIALSWPSRPPAARTATAAPRLARAADQRAPLPRHLAARRSCRSSRRVQRQPAGAAVRPPLPPTLRPRRGARRSPPISPAAIPTARPGPPAPSARRGWFSTAQAVRRSTSRRPHDRSSDDPRPRAPCRSQPRRDGAVGTLPDAIVVMAHRDNTGRGPGANDNASGTAALSSSRALCARPATSGSRARPALPHDRLPLHRRRRVRRARRRATSPRIPRTRPHRRRRQPRRHRRRRAAPRLELAGDRPRSPPPRSSRPRRRGSPSRPATSPSPASALEPADRPRLPVQPLRAGAVRGRGMSRRVTLTTAGDRPPPRFADTTEQSERASDSAARRAPHRRCSARSTRGSELTLGHLELRLPRTADRAAAGRSSSC